MHFSFYWFFLALYWLNFVSPIDPQILCQMRSNWSSIYTCLIFEPSCLFGADLWSHIWVAESRTTHTKWNNIELHFIYIAYREQSYQLNENRDLKMRTLAQNNFLGKKQQNQSPFQKVVLLLAYFYEGWLKLWLVWNLSLDK